MWKNILQHGSLISMHRARWILKATNTHSEYVILSAFPLPQWLHERAPMLRLTYTETTHALSLSRDAVTKPTFSISGFTVRPRSSPSENVRLGATILLRCCKDYCHCWMWLRVVKELKLFNSTKAVRIRFQIKLDNTRGVQGLRSPNLLKKTTHHRKLKMQSFLNVITL